MKSRSLGRTGIIMSKLNKDYRGEYNVWKKKIEDWDHKHRDWSMRTIEKSSRKQNKMIQIVMGLKKLRNLRPEPNSSRKISNTRDEQTRIRERK